MSGPITFLNTLAAVLAFAALASYVNHRFLRLPTTVALMSMALLGSLALVAGGAIGVIDTGRAEELVEAIAFDQVVLHGLLGYLLFAGALHINLAQLRAAVAPVATFASLGVVVSAATAGTLFWLIARVLGFDLPYIYALVFGTLIAPTDPVAVLGILKNVRAPKSIETTIASESLFNDGIGVVLFLTVLSVAVSGQEPNIGEVLTFLTEEAVGGVVLGLALGALLLVLMRGIDAYQVEVLLSLGFVSGGYALATALHFSGPITVVVMGIIIGNYGRVMAMSEVTREYVDRFWELLDEILNAVLFILVGIEVIIISVTGELVAAGILAIGAVLLARFISIAGPAAVFRAFGSRRFGPGTVAILTWGGLRGGISIALALSIPASSERDLLLTAAYIVVIFSILVQGLTFGPLVRRLVATGRVNGGAEPSVPAAEIDDAT